MSLLTFQMSPLTIEVSTFTFGLKYVCLLAKLVHFLGEPAYLFGEPSSPLKWGEGGITSGVNTCFNKKMALFENSAFKLR